MGGFGLGAAWLLAVTLVSWAGEVVPITRDAVVEGQLGPNDEVAAYSVAIPAGEMGFDVRVSSAADVDLFVSRAPFTDEDRFDRAAVLHAGAGAGASVRVLAADHGPVEGTWIVEVVRPQRTASARFSLRVDRVRRDRLPRPTAIRTDEEDVDGRVVGDMQFAVDVTGDRGYRTFRIDVPRRARSMTVLAEGSTGDVDLFARRRRQMANYESDPDASRTSNAWDEVLHLSRRGTPRLRPGAWYLDVARGQDRDVNTRLTVRFDRDEPVDFALRRGAAHAKALTLGKPARVRIDRKVDDAATFVVNLPAGHRSLHFRTLDASRDIDLYVRRGEPVSDYEEGYTWKAYSGRIAEHLDIHADKGETLEPGPYFVDVVSFVDGDKYIDVELLAAVDNAPAVDFMAQWTPVRDAMALADGVWATAATSTVEIRSEDSWGSGVVLGSGGWIITNAHVLRDDEGNVPDSVWVGVTGAWDALPVQLFEAVAEEIDEDLDLALVRITTDLQGEQLPEDWSLPQVSVADPAALNLGEPLTVVGYPIVGGQGSRSPVSVAHGVLSGALDRDGQRRWIKTDARINAGNSGGPIFSDAGELVCIATHEMVEGDDELGYCRPWTLIPESWWQRAGRPMPGTVEPRP